MPAQPKKKQQTFEDSQILWTVEQVMLFFNKFCQTVIQLGVMKVKDKWKENANMISN